MGFKSMIGLGLESPFLKTSSIFTMVILLYTKLTLNYIKLMVIDNGLSADYEEKREVATL